MDIRVSGHQVETGASLQEHTEHRLDGVVEKYFGKAISSQVTFGKEKRGVFACDIITHALHGHVFKAHARAQDAHAALELAAAKLDKQLRRYKRRIKDRHQQADHARLERAAALGFKN
jgi:ribosomal subunit interface protein